MLGRQGTENSEALPRIPDFETRDHRKFNPKGAFKNDDDFGGK